MKKQWIKPGVFALVLIAAMVFSGCEEVAYRGLSFTAGPQYGEAVAHNGMIRTRVEFSRNSILSIDVLSGHLETAKFAETAIEIVPNLIVQYQSLNLAPDIVRGATITSGAIRNAVANAVQLAGEDPSRLMGRRVSRPQDGVIVNIPEDVNYEVEIIIVGAGAAGKTAAIFAAERAPGTARIILLEAMPGYGGNAILGGGLINNPNIHPYYRPHLLTDEARTFWAEEVERVLNNPPADMRAPLVPQVRGAWNAHRTNHPDRIFDSPDFFILQGGGAMGPPGMPFMPSHMDSARRQVAFADWLNNNGMQWARPTVIVAGSPWPRAARPLHGRLGEGYFSFFADHIRVRDLGHRIELKTETRATELITHNGQPDGNVIGVRARHVSGREYNITSNRGVVLATGGFGANDAMVSRFTAGPFSWPANMLHTNQPGSMGDGITMVEALGARLTGMNTPMTIMVLPVGDARTGVLDSLVGSSGTGLFVNIDGMRFVDETADRLQVSRDILAQPLISGQGQARMWVISDLVNSGIINPEGPVSGWLTSYGTSVSMLLNTGRLIKANTIRDLAIAIGVHPPELIRTIEAYNLFAGGTGECPFGRTLFPPGTAITTGPFFASPRVPAVHGAMMGGVARHPDNWQAVRGGADPPPPIGPPAGPPGPPPPPPFVGAPIEGLWIIGELGPSGALAPSFAEGIHLMEHIIYP